MTKIAGLQLHAPTLLDYELASVARTRIFREPDRRSELLQSLDDALACEVQRHDVHLQEVVQLALATRLSTYDASYLWLARHLVLPLLTFDQRLKAAAEG